MKKISFPVIVWALMSAIGAVCTQAADTPTLKFLPSAQANAAVQKRLDAMAAASDAKLNLAYKTVGDVACTMDLFLPTTVKDKDGKAFYPDGAPVVLFFHGGGWAAGSRYTTLEGIALPETVKFFSDRGIALALVSYRFIGNGLGVQDCIADAFDAVRYLALHAQEYRLDAKRMLSCGGSAGGHLALMLLYANPDAFAGDAALKNATFSFVGGVMRAPPVVFPGTVHRNFAPEMAPMHWISAGAARALLVHGDKDTAVSIQDSELFANKAKELGVEVTLLKVPNADHHFKGKHQPLAGLTRNIFLNNLYAMARESLDAKPASTPAAN